MIVTSVRNVWDTVYDQYRKTVVKTLEDPKTGATSIQTEQYVYDKSGKVQQNNTGNSIDKLI